MIEKAVEWIKARYNLHIFLSIDRLAKKIKLLKNLLSNIFKVELAIKCNPEEGKNVKMAMKFNTWKDLTWDILIASLRCNVAY